MGGRERRLSTKDRNSPVVAAGALCGRIYLFLPSWHRPPAPAAGSRDGPLVPSLRSGPSRTLRFLRSRGTRRLEGRPPALSGTSQAQSPGREFRDGPLVPSLRSGPSRTLLNLPPWSGTSPAQSPGRELGVRSVNDLNLRVGPTWVCFAVPCGCPDHPHTRAERGVCAPGKRSVERLREVHPRPSAYDVRARCVGGSRVDGRRDEHRPEVRTCRKKKV
jgi:hypothetical protein